MDRPTEITHSLEELNNLIDSYKCLHNEFIKIGNLIWFSKINKSYHQAALSLLKEIKNLNSDVLTSQYCDIELKALKTTIFNAEKKFKFLKKHFSSNWSAISNFLDEDVCNHLNKKHTSIEMYPSIPGPSKPSPVKHVQVQTLDKELRTDCANCVFKRISNENLLKENKKLKQEKLSLMKAHAALKRLYEVRKVNQKLKRMTQRLLKKKQEIISLKRTIKALPVHNYVQQKEKMKYIKRRNKILKSKIDSNTLTLKNNKLMISNQSKEIVSLNQVIDDLTCRFEEITNKDQIITKKGKEFDTDTRLCMYKSLLCNVSVASAGDLLEFFIETMTGQKLSSVPSQTTVAQMSLELGILADIQIGEALMLNKNVTLSWDATPVDGAHVNEIHISTAPDRPLILDVRELPGAKASDYAQHIFQSLQHVTSLYANHKKIPEANVSIFCKSLIQKISSTVTDRAPVNHCVVQQLNILFDTQILELNCNVHPLDGFASAARKSILEYEKSSGLTSSTSLHPKAVHCLMDVSKLRYSMKTGDPPGFKLFCKKFDIPIGMFMRYVGNRMHILFHLSGVIIFYRSNLLTYVSKNQASNLKRNIKSYLEDPIVVAQLTTLALIGKSITGPWMTKFYSNQSNLGLVPVIQGCQSEFERFVSSPLEILTLKSNIFGEPINQEIDPVLKSLISNLNPETTELIKNMIPIAVQSIYLVFKRQLYNYIEGNLSNPSSEMMEQASSAPAHNMASERALGLTDYLWRRAPNSTFMFISGKVKSRFNNTMSWLLKKPEDELKKTINFSMKEAYKLRKLNHLKMKANEKEALERQVETEKLFDKKNRKMINKQIKKALKTNDFSSEIFKRSSPEIVNQFNLITAKTSDLPTFLIGQQINHLWDVEGKDVLYNGRIVDVYFKGQKNPEKYLTVSYWKPDEVEDESVDYNIILTDFLTDLILHDLMLI